MKNNIKNDIYVKNIESFAEFINELSENYEVDREEIKEYLQRIMEIINSNDLIYLTEDMSEVRSILEYVTSDQSSKYNLKLVEERGEDVNYDSVSQQVRTTYEKPRSIDESVEYYVRYFFENAFPERIREN